MERKKYLVVTAGGTGTRMGAAVPKQFLTLDGVPILRRSIEAFLRAVPDIQVITVLPEAHIAYWRQYCLKENFICPQRLVKGGFTRFHSVKNALKYVPGNAIVAVHDGVRPLVTPAKIKELFSMAENASAVIPVMPVTDTLKVLDKKDGVFVSAGESIDRSRIFGAQTPQVFQADKLKAAYTLQFDTLFTDDASVAERYGIPLTFAQGERFNLKITTPEDLVLAKAILNQSLPE
ncbi:MAG: 2-C-methyl-D-erythritol 4-phosphate cytidylyltransferase [Bacteroidales bacterium]|nr:2-C-methyl-D-erythritol 4-phosphate cytidylyltransferase [Bacteroidales bacterium]